MPIRKHKSAMQKRITLIALQVSDDIFIAGIVLRLHQTPTLIDVSFQFAAIELS